MTRQRAASLQTSLRVGALAVLVGVAIAYFALPARAAENCAWRTEMMEDEGGPVLKAFACSDDTSASELYVACGGGTFWLSYDLAKDGGRLPEPGETASVEFVTDGGVAALPLQYQEMDGLFAGEMPASGDLMRLLKSEASMLVRDTASTYPAKTFSLKGSAAALSALAAGCR